MAFSALGLGDVVVVFWGGESGIFRDDFCSFCFILF